MFLFLYISTLIAVVVATQPPAAPKTYPFIDGIEWLRVDSSLLVRLATPSIPLYVWSEGDGSLLATDTASAVLLNFTLTRDHRALLLQDQPFLPLSNPSEPPLLRAFQVPAKGSVKIPQSGSHLMPLTLDYERLVHPRDDFSINYSNWVPTISLNVLGAGTKQIVRVTLKDSNSFPTQNPPDPSFQIVRAWIEDQSVPGVSEYTSRPCSLTSYRCPDLDTAPWYEYVSRQDFDEYGRIGSLRHLLVQRWSILYTNVGPTILGVLAAILTVVVLWPSAHRIYRCIRRIRTRRLKERLDTADWLEDEEESNVLLSGEEHKFRERWIPEHHLSTSEPQHAGYAGSLHQDHEKL
ncbi:hypothetical protein BP5796_06755 [Coleophoma crateriformis]|uniref:Uncharacterized protein n=1 Tax=Coleophoma crateriformis TaxID=565419 RepID=A0A3D8RPX8_9HELO|nr:hypothetical protein BP5796_06755 [Coleophoma crateriformis]